MPPTSTRSSAAPSRWQVDLFRAELGHVLSRAREYGWTRTAELLEQAARTYLEERDGSGTDA